MYAIVLLLHVLIAVILIGLVLLQRGKGASMGAAFGSGASQTVFGSQGSSSFLLKFTGFLGGVFFATTIGLGYISSAYYQRVQELALPTGLEQEVALPSQTLPGLQESESLPATQPQT